MILGRCSASREPGPRTQGDVPKLVFLVWACQHHLTLQFVSADPFPFLSVIQLQVVVLAWAAVTKCPRLGGVHRSFLNSGSQLHIWQGPRLSSWGSTVASCWSPTMCASTVRVLMPDTRGRCLRLRGSGCVLNFRFLFFLSFFFLEKKISSYKSIMV